MKLLHRFQQVWLPFSSFVIFSALVAALVYWAFSDRDAPNIVNAIWLFYAPIWILCNAMFGGIHGAPAWSFLPSVVMAVVGQNLILWLGVRWIYLYCRRRTTKQAESNR